MQVEVIVLRALQLAAELGEQLQRLQRGVDALQGCTDVVLPDSCGSQLIRFIN